jgi:hypothetical protein
MDWGQSEFDELAAGVTPDADEDDAETDPYRYDDSDSETDDWETFGGIEYSEEEKAAFRAAAASRAAGDHYEPYEHIAEFDAQNEINLKSTPQGGQISFVSKGRVVLIGGNHDPRAQEWINESADGQMSGVITIRKGRMLRGPGALTVQVAGTPIGMMEFEEAINAVSKKEVIWGEGLDVPSPYER